MNFAGRLRKTFSKRGRRRLSFDLLQRLAMLTRLVGFARLRRIGTMIGELQFRLGRRNRLQYTRDVAQVLGRRPDDPVVKATLRQSYHVNNGAVLEIMAMYDHPLSDEQIREHCRVHNAQRLDAQLESGRPVVLLGSHMGNASLSQAWIARSGRPLSVVYRESHKIRRGFFDAGLAHYGIEGIAADDGTRAYRKMLKALRAGRMVYVTLDQGTKRAGVAVNFLGKQINMPEGPAQLARHAGAIVVPISTLAHRPAWEFNIEEPVELNPQGPVADDVKKLTKVMEQQILAAPHLWSWHHRRWRKYPFPVDPSGEMNGK